MSIDGLLIYEDVAAERLEQIRDTILAWSAKQRSYPSKNVGGWKSSETVFSKQDPVLDALGAEIREYVYSFGGVGKDTGKGRSWDGVMHGWAMVNPTGAEHPRHQHYRTVVTGLYFIDAGLDDLELATPTIFEATEAEILRAEVGADGTIAGTSIDRDKGELALAPIPGRLVLFPGRMWHRVPRVHATRPRITIAFDVRY